MQPWTFEVCVCKHLHLHAINHQNMYSANTRTVLTLKQPQISFFVVGNANSTTATAEQTADQILRSSKDFLTFSDGP